MIENLAAVMRTVDIRSITEKTETVYVLISNGRVVYVGSTCNLAQRIGSHVAGVRGCAPKTFDRVLALDVSKDDAAAMEGALVRYFVPPLCKRTPNDETRDAEMLARFGLEPSAANRDAFIAHRAEIFAAKHRRLRIRRLAASRRQGRGLSAQLWKSTLRYLKRLEASS